MCKISAFSSAKTYQKVECLHIWKIQVYIYIYIGCCLSLYVRIQVLIIAVIFLLCSENVDTTWATRGHSLEFRFPFFAFQFRKRTCVNFQYEDAD